MGQADPSRPRTNRAFTMLELSLAMVVASLIVLACLTVFASLDASDRHFTVRTEELAEAELVHLAMTRAMEQFVVPFGSQAQADRGDRAGGASPARPSGARPPAAPARVPSGDGPPERPSFMLGENPAYPSIRMARPLSSGQVVILGEGDGPQRLELLVGQPPVAAAPTVQERLAVARAAADFDRTRRRDDGAVIDPRVLELLGGDRGARLTRGMFEIVPDGADGPDRRWSIRWVPIDRTTDERGVEVYLPRTAGAVPLARGLRWARWEVFHHREWKAALELDSADEIPSYVRLRLMTGSGLEMSWLFEISWRIATDESEADPAAPGTTEVGSGSAAPPPGEVIVAPARPAGGDGVDDR